jgi:exonuclease III
MKIITLNTWGGRAGRDGMLSFFEKYKDTTSVFCLQEIWSAAYEHLDGHDAGGVPIRHDNIMVRGLQEISSLLTGHSAYFRPHFMDNYGLLMLAHKNISVTEEGEHYVYKEKGYIPEGDVGNHARNIQYAMVEREPGLLTIINFHGIWNGKGKTDTEDRIQQSKNIVDFIREVKGDVILCGDFNLLPDTESIKILEDAGLRNLIREYGVTSTRTSHYTKPEKYADYVFLSKRIKVKDFKVLPDEVSDHSALCVEIED